MSHLSCKPFTIALLTGLVALGATAEIPLVPRGEDLQVNSYTHGDQQQAAVARLADHGFVVAWRSDGSDSVAEPSILAQRLGADGSPVAEEIRVGSSSLSAPGSLPAVASQPSGEFVVAWRPPGYPFRPILVRRFAADGSGSTVQQASVGNYRKTGSAAIASSPNGDFAVVWHDISGGGGDGGEIFLRLLDSSGVPVGQEVHVNTQTDGGQRLPRIAYQPNGDFVVVWESNSGAGQGGTNVAMQRFDPNGEFLGAEVEVAGSDSIFSHQEPALAIRPEGDFVVAWKGPAVVGTWIEGRNIAADGTPGSFFQISGATIDAVLSPTLTVDETGRMVAVWGHLGDGDGSGLRARSISAAGTVDGAVQQVPTLITGDQSRPAAATVGSELLIVWDSTHSTHDDQSGISVQARSWDLGIFADGFESGTLSAWSGSSP